MSTMNIAVLDDDDLEENLLLSSQRTRIYAEFLKRAKNGNVVLAKDQDIGEIINLLMKKGLVYFQKEDDGSIAVVYGPSTRSGDSLSNQISHWPEKVSSKIKKSLRVSEGSLCLLQQENGKPGVEVFVTDWSSSTGSCAVAVHPYHDFVTGAAPNNSALPYFTGSYVRNPLTGDFMSVWVADWVKPDFGTGAVLINPAHNKLDLDFARAVGLPIRFALSLHELGSPEALVPIPPVLKAGKAIRAGFLDGKSASEVHNETINTLIQRGCARVHSDKRLPSQVIARLKLGAGGDWRWNSHTGLLAKQTTAPDGVSIEACTVLNTAVSVVTQKPDLIVIGAEAQKKYATTLATLIFDLSDDSQFVPIELMAPVEYSGSREVDHTLQFALLVGEAPSKPLVVRKTLIEQIEGFQAGMQILVQRLSKAGEDGQCPPVTVEQALKNGDATVAFRELYRWQKSVIHSNSIIDQGSYTAVLKTFGISGAGQFDLI